ARERDRSTSAVELGAKNAKNADAPRGTCSKSQATKETETVDDLGPTIHLLNKNERVEQQRTQLIIAFIELS
ncbi:unnamed protein product, partial [Allacma fusca]